MWLFKLFKILPALIILTAFIGSIYAVVKEIEPVTVASPVILGTICMLYVIGLVFDKG